MKKLSTILTVFLLAVSVPAIAQFNWGIKAGMNMAEKPSKLKELDAKGKTGWFIGPTAKVTLPIVGLGVEANLLYSQSKSEILGKSVTRKSIELPLFLRYEFSLPAINKFLEPFIAIGPQWGWNLGDKDLKLYEGKTAKEEYKIKDSNLSLNLGLGAIVLDHVQFHINYNLALGKTSEYNIYDHAGDIITNKKSKTNTWQVSVAYIF